MVRVIILVFFTTLWICHAAESSSSNNGGRLEQVALKIPEVEEKLVEESSGEVEDYHVEEDEEEDDGEWEEDSKERPELEKEDIIESVRKLEKDAEEEEKLDLLPEVLGVVLPQNGAWMNLTAAERNKYRVEVLNDTSLPEDLTELPESIVEDVEAGVDEFLQLSSDEGFRSSKGNNTVKRNFPIYMFQGQYVPEPRLNRFIDGAVRNFGTEVRIAVMDPLYFRVLPKGQVESRAKPFGNNQLRSESLRSLEKPEEPEEELEAENRGAANRKVSLNIFKRPARKGGVVKRRRVNNNNDRNRNKKKNVNRRRQPGKYKRPNQGNRRKIINRRKPGKNGQRKRPFNANRRRPNNNNNKNRRKNNNRNKNKNPRKKIINRINNNRRQKRRAKRNVGGGRVEGLSHMTRDGDAEMQVFGNYTLIRSHMKVGPIELSMQFRTRKGLRRTGATIPFMRMHTVARVNNEGSEMVDFLLDRPHPESIKVRGKLFPLAQRMAKNIFSRLFLPTSFLHNRLREKAALALLSKPRRR